MDVQTYLNHITQLYQEGRYLEAIQYTHQEIRDNEYDKEPGFIMTDLLNLVLILSTKEDSQIQSYLDLMRMKYK